MFDIAKAIRTLFRVLGFRATPGEIKENAIAILTVGFLVTWVVGIGRWWDDPRDLLPFVRWGVGSVFYTIALSLVLWVLGLPLSKERLRYQHVLAFVTCTSLPGLVYAIPMEIWADQRTASSYNLYALLFVSIYRVSLLLWFFLKIQELTVRQAIVATFLPISMIALSLTSLGHGARIMDIMGGFRDRMSKTAMEEVVGLIGCLSYMLGPILLLVYLAMVIQASVERRSPKK